MSWFCVNFWKAALVMSWIDSILRDTDWVMSWFKSICRESTRVESPKKVTRNQHLSANPKKGHTKSTVKLNAPKKGTRNWEWITFLSHELIWIRIQEFFELWVNLNQNSGIFSSRVSMWVKFQYSILSCELIWINSCDAIVNYELSRIKTFWN